MKRRLIGTLIIFSLCATGCMTVHKANQVCFKHNCYNVELALTQSQWVKGLQNRDTLPSRQGMLFIFDDVTPKRFWMKDTRIALDMIWIDRYQKVIAIDQNVLPCAGDPCPTYGPSMAVSYVLEIGSGEAQRINLKQGDNLVFRLKE